MTPENTNAQEKALEALIAASLRAPDKETEVTEAEISRYVDQCVTLSSEDEAALEEAKPRIMQAIGNILQGNVQENDDCTIRPSKAGHGHPEQFCAMNRKNTTNEFSQITESELDRKRREMIERVKKKQDRTGS
jgi:hypothetical protein